MLQVLIPIVFQCRTGEVAVRTEVNTALWETSDFPSSWLQSYSALATVRVQEWTSRWKRSLSHPLPLSSKSEFQTDKSLFFKKMLFGCLRHLHVNLVYLSSSPRSASKSSFLPIHSLGSNGDGSSIHIRTTNTGHRLGSSLLVSPVA